MRLIPWTEEQLMRLYNRIEELTGRACSDDSKPLCVCSYSGFISDIFKVAFDVDLSRDIDELSATAVHISPKELATGDIVVFQRVHSDEQLGGIILGYIQKQLTYFSVYSRKIEVVDFSEIIGDFSLKTCLRVLDR